jgi:hypothetical protein
MAHALRIYDGTTTYSLSTTNAYLTLYVPTEAQPGETSVTESVELMFYGASASAMQTAIQSLQRLLDGIRRRQQWGVGPVTYFQFQPDGEWGHVAYVASVNGQSGEWSISEMNFIGLNIISKRTFSREAAASYTFIHGKKGAPQWNPLPISLP